MIITFTVFEIPSGAIADLLGKKKTLFASFLFQAAGNIVMGIAPSFSVLGIGVFIVCVGGALYSGTMEALIYDSLIDEKKEKLYDKVIANVNTIQLIAPAVASIIGGFLYAIKPSLPFLVLGLFYFIASLLSTFLKEPLVDTEKFSLKNFISQTKQGVKILFSTTKIKQQTLMLLSTAVFIVITDEMLNDILAVEFGFSETQLGIFIAACFLLSAGASQLTPYLKKRLGEIQGLLLMGFIIALSLIISPLAGLILGGLSLIIRFSLQAIYNNFISIIVNRNTSSQYRATTLSTFNMIKNMPYVLTAFLAGTLVDIFSAQSIAFVLGIILVVLVSAQVFMLRVKR